jgi:hypothetical protein
MYKCKVISAPIALRNYYFAKKQQFSLQFAQFEVNKESCLIFFAAFPTLTHSLTCCFLRFDFVFTCFTHPMSVCIQSKITLSINTTHNVFLHSSSLPNILLNPVRPAKHGVFTYFISLFLSVSLPFPFNNFFISFLCS